MAGNAAIYNELKRRIISLEFKPGEMIREKEIMQSLNASRPPVREALVRLEYEGFVRIIPNAGTIVMEISFQHLKDIFEVRSHCISFAGRLAASRISHQDIDKIRECIGAMKATSEVNTWMKLDEQIHRIINNATRNEILVKLLDGLHEQSSRILNSVGVESGYWEKLIEEFEHIVLALEQGDEKTAAHLLEDHTNLFSDHIKRQLAYNIS